jgi:hypothetical protein
MWSHVLVLATCFNVLSLFVVFSETLTKNIILVWLFGPAPISKDCVFDLACT